MEHTLVGETAPSRRRSHRTTVVLAGVVLSAAGPQRTLVVSANSLFFSETFSIVNEEGRSMENDEQLWMFQFSKERETEQSSQLIWKVKKTYFNHGNWIREGPVCNIINFIFILNGFFKIIFH